MYFYWQATPTSTWTCALASERERVVRDKQPAFVTILDVDNTFERDLTLDEMRAVRFLGPWYTDFDGESIEEVIPQFQALLNKLRERGLDLNQVRLFATGGRGFHVEIPMGVFMPKIPNVGLPGLPHIYREMAHDLFVDLMDMRVYTAKRGRMWRCPGVERDNGLFKVGITPAEALAMTPERYSQLCSSPRSPLPIDPPTFNPDLGLLFARAKDKIEASNKKAKSKKSKVAELKRFGGQWPETVQRILKGEDLKDGVGWNRIAMQLALTADALGKKEEQLLADAEPLLETYSGDSDRYGSYRKRKSHLQEMFRYLAGNITYDWSVGGIVALVQKDADVSDLTAGEYVPDEATEEATEEASSQDDDEDDTVAGAVRVAKSGIYVRGKDGEGWSRACHVGLANPVRLLDIKEGVAIGYEVEVFVEGKSKGTHELPLKAFGGRSRFQDWTMSWSSAVRGNDNDISSLADVLRRKTDRSNKVMYTLSREGVDVVLRRGETEPDLVYASAHGVLSSKKNSYRFRSEFDSNHAGYSDLMLAPPMEDTSESRELIDNLLVINTPLNLALVLGWMSAAFLCQPLRRIGRRFPTLQVYGQAGAGKSSMIETVANLHYYQVPPRKLAASGQTAYPIIAAVTSNGSTPVIFEELKRREMTKNQIDFLMNVLRNNYDGSNLQRGALSDTPGKGPVIRDYADVAPLVILGEGLETQSAILERCIVLSLSKQDRYGREDAYNFVEANRQDLGQLGRQMVNAIMTLDYKALSKSLVDNRARVKAAMGDDADGKDRPIHNHAVLLIGLEFMRSVLQSIFGDRYNERFEVMVDRILSNLSSIIPDNKSEASRVIDCLARLTREDDSQYRLERSKDYTVTPEFVDLKMKNVYPKYVRYTRSLGQDPLYDSSDAFIAGLANYAGLVDRVCMDNQVLKVTPIDVVFRFSVQHLAKENIEHFQP